MITAQFKQHILKRLREMRDYDSQVDSIILNFQVIADFGRNITKIQLLIAGKTLGRGEWVTEFVNDDIIANWIIQALEDSDYYFSDITFEHS
jgi:hypothetical protein